MPFDFSLKNIAGLGLAVAVCLLPGALGSIATSSAIDSWYRELDKPWFNPPGWVFGPVWTILYVLIGISLFLIWKSGDRSSSWYLLFGIFAVQLVLNTGWSLAFFGLESPIAGLLVIVPLWIAILSTILLSYRFTTTGSLILVPYLIWVSFATVLNFEIWRLN